MGDFRHERVRDQRPAGGGGRRRAESSVGGARTGTFGRGPVLATTLLALGAAAAIGPAAASADPPAGRAYERVSPVEKPSGATGLSTRQGGLAMPARSADVGDRLVYGLTANVEGSPSSAPNPLIFGERTATGWRARTAIRSTDNGDTPLEVALHEARSAWLTADGRDLAFGTGRPLGWMVGGAFGQIYRAADSDAAPTWLSEPTGGIEPAPGIQAVTLSTGDDTRTGAFVSTVRLTPDGPATGSAVYGYRDGGLELFSRLPDESAATGGLLANSPSATALNGLNAAARTKRNEVAGNGRYVLFLTGSTTTAPLYVRDLDQNETRQLAGGIGQPQRAVSLNLAAANPGPATIPGGLVFGAKNAARAFFYGEGTVGQAATRVMYEADLLTGGLTQRPAITGTPIELTADGRRMLFLTAPTGTVRQLRYWDAADPSTSVLVAEINGGITNTGYVRVFSPSADGQTWIFSAAGSPDPGRPNVAPATRQLYRWTVGQSSPTPTCLSCEPVDGVVRTTGVNLAVQEGGWSETLLNPAVAVQPGDDATLLAQPGHGLSADGRYLLFDSPDRLVDEDENDVRDVYLWDRDGSDGQLQLVTSGQGSTPSWALDLSPDGVNAFFLTREALVSGDQDGAYDVYTARIGEGFPEAPDESCVGEACRDAVIPDPPRGSVGSDRLTPPSVGRGQEVQSGTPKLRVRSVRTASRQVTVRVDTPKAGRIRISGKTVRTTTRAAKRATTYTLRVPLSASTQRQVARGRSVKVSLRVSFTPQGAKKATLLSTSVTIKKGR